MSDPTQSPAALAEEFRHAMAHVCTPVSVITAFDADRPHGTTVAPSPRFR